MTVFREPDLSATLQFTCPGTPRAKSTNSAPKPRPRRPSGKPSAWWWNYGPRFQST